jgi:hypothetical protein
MLTFCRDRLSRWDRRFVPRQLLYPEPAPSLVHPPEAYFSFITYPCGGVAFVVVRGPAERSGRTASPTRRLAPASGYPARSYGPCDFGRTQVQSSSSKTPNLIAPASVHPLLSSTPAINGARVAPSTSKAGGAFPSILATLGSRRFRSPMEQQRNRITAVGFEPTKTLCCPGGPIFV